MASEPPVTKSSGGMIGRIVAILTRPKQEWEAIAAEPMTAKGILLGWVLPLTLIQPIAELVAAGTNGYTLYGALITPPAGFLAANFLASWLAAVAWTYLLGLAIGALADRFGGQKDVVAGLKVAAFGSTAIYLSSIFLISPFLSLLAILGLYSYYLFYEGLPALMKTPRDKALLFAVALFLISAVLQVAGRYAGAMIANSFLPVPTPGSIWAP